MTTMTHQAHTSRDADLLTRTGTALWVTALLLGLPPLLGGPGALLVPAVLLGAAAIALGITAGRMDDARHKAIGDPRLG